MTAMRLLLVVLVLLLVPASSAMGSGRDVLRDCADDEVLSKTYTQREYRQALEQLATDSSEYSDCETVIRRAQLAQAAGRDRNSDGGSGSGGGGGGASGGGGSGGGGSGGGGSSGEGADPAPPGSGDPLGTLSPEEQQALAEARREGGSAIESAAVSVAPPGASRAPGVTGSNELPGPVAGLLILLAGALVLVTGARVRTRVLGRRAA